MTCSWNDAQMELAAKYQWKQNPDKVSERVKTFDIQLKKNLRGEIPPKTVKSRHNPKLSITQPPDGENSEIANNQTEEKCDARVATNDDILCAI